MSARYELRTQGGVYDRKLQRVVLPTDGEAWAEYHDVFLAGGGIPDPPQALPAPTFAQLRADKILAVDVLAGDMRRRITAPSSPSEMASWTEKLRQARAYDGGDASSPMLALEGQARGTSTKDIVDRVLKNADAFSKAEALIAGASGKHRDTIAAIAAIDELVAYDITAGWPFGPDSAGKAPA